MTRKVLYVEWEDSCTTNGWRELDTSGPVTIKSIGWVIHRAKNFIVLATSESSSGRIIDQLTIPTSCITKTRRIEPHK